MFYCGFHFCSVLLPLQSNTNRVRTSLVKALFPNKAHPPQPPCIVTEIEIVYMIEEQCCLLGRAALCDRGRETVAQKKTEWKNTLNLFLVLKTAKKGLLVCVFFLSACFVFFLGLLGFELETPTANTGSTLPGLRVRTIKHAQSLFGQDENFRPLSWVLVPQYIFG